jgi:BirA family biotin operon repressor/biotin-[acetyl-CoA-carboxylase] ligase
MKKTNPYLIEIVKILHDGDYHDGTGMGEHLNITRTAVWKLIKKLQQRGVAIESCKGRGYKLLEPLLFLNENEIHKKLKNKKIKIKIFESVKSTNDYFQTAKLSPCVSICLAEEQTQGRGRLNRQWYSPYAKNIYMSCLYQFKKDMSELAGLSLVISLAIIKTINHFGIDQNLFLKWPNDIIYFDHQSKKKLSGCLVEIRAETHGLSHAIIGIGINVNMIDGDKSINQPFTSMQKITDKVFDRNEVCAELINQLLDHIERFNLYGFKTFIREWTKLDYLLNKVITLKNNNKKIIGTARGVNTQGYLLLQLEDDSICAFSSGDTSVA